MLAYPIYVVFTLRTFNLRKENALKAVRKKILYIYY
jgi:hypothetical protein